MHFSRLVTGLLALALSGMALASAGAQSGPPGSPDGKSAPVPPPALPRLEDLPRGDAQPAVPQPANPDAKLLGKLPQTADEKSKLLGNLYAHLAAAEDEEQAKKISDRIERIWLLSGSDTVSLLLERVGKAMHDKRPELALKLLDQVVALAPDYAEGFNRRAFFHFTQGNFEAAVGDLRRVLALDPNHYKALEGLAQIWRDTGNKRGAYQVIKQLMDIHPFAAGAKPIYEELKREIDGQGI